MAESFQKEKVLNTKFTKSIRQVTLAINDSFNAKSILEGKPTNTLDAFHILVVILTVLRNGSTQTIKVQIITRNTPFTGFLCLLADHITVLDDPITKPIIE